MIFDNIDDPHQTADLVKNPDHESVLSAMRIRIKTKMVSINDTFEESLYYKEHSVSEDRRIVRTATPSP